MGVLKAGSQVPEFSLTRADGSAFTRRDLAGGTSVLVFFPAAFSSVCSDQLALYEELLAEFSARGATLYGVSCDQRESQDAFRSAHGLSIELLSDFEPKGAASRAFGCYFDPTGVSNRALVVVGPDLTVRWSWEGEHPGVMPGADLVFEGIAAARA